MLKNKLIELSSLFVKGAKINIPQVETHVVELCNEFMKWKKDRIVNKEFLELKYSIINLGQMFQPNVMINVVTLEGNVVNVCKCYATYMNNFGYTF